MTRQDYSVVKMSKPVTSTCAKGGASTMSNENPVQTEIDGLSFPQTKRAPGRPEVSKNKKKVAKKKVANKTRKQRATVINGNPKQAAGRPPYTNAQKFASLENRLASARSEFRKETNTLKEEIKFLHKRVNQVKNELDGHAYNKTSHPFSFTNNESKSHFKVEGDINKWHVLTAVGFIAAIAALIYYF